MHRPFAEAGAAPPGGGAARASLADVLAARASAAPDARAFTFLANGEQESAAWTWADLARRTGDVAAALARRVPRGERALLLYPPGLEFVAAFLGCLRAGIVAVPAQPPLGGRAARGEARLAAIIADAEPAVVLSTSAVARRGLAPRDVPWLLTDEVAPGGDVAGVAPGGANVAFLQYTSGSTAAPRGVMVTHDNLASNLEYAARFSGDEGRGPSVSWLPVTHDMGLIEGVLQPIWSGTPVYLMSPSAFLQRPARWLEAISRHRAVRSGGPNFAYDLVARRSRPEDIAGLDLTGWQVAFNGAEPVHAETMALFSRTFAAAGFASSAFRPCYGLAEATLLVSSGRWNGRATGRVRCGPARGETVAFVVDPDTRSRVADGHIGEIWVSGPGVARGYWRQEARSAPIFRATSPGVPGRFLRTGDLGCIQAGELVVTGRLKDLLIVRGAKHFAEDLETTAGLASPALRPGSATAFADAHDASGDRIVIVVEIEARRRLDVPASGVAIDAIRRAVAEQHGIQLEGVVVVAPGSVPKTTSGKRQRFACRERLRAGELPVVALWRAAGVAGRAS